MSPSTRANHISNAICEAVHSLTLAAPAALHEPSFDERDKILVQDCIESTFVSSVGKYVDLFETKLAEYVGVKRAVAVVNGTAALQIALLISDVRPGDEVLMPSLTFVATANAVKHCSAIPHFVDVESSTLGMCPDKLSNYLESITSMREGRCFNKATGREIKAVMPMHCFGHPVRMDPIIHVAERFNLKVVEDATESLGSRYRNRFTGSIGNVGVLSFNGNKIITTGGGGAILTDDDSIADLAKHLTTTAKVSHPWAYEHDMVAFNYRMPNLNAALGCGQLEKQQRFLKAKRDLYGHYSSHFANCDGFKLMKEPNECESNYWLQTIILERSEIQFRDLILNETNNMGISTRPSWVPMHKLEIFKNCPQMDLSETDNLNARIINIPSSVSLIGNGE